MKRFDIFISYRRRDTGDKAEHLKDLLDEKYKNRVSFDRENLTGLFDVALAQRIDTCKDFLILVSKNTFNFTSKDFDPEQVELYNYLATCSIEEFSRKIEELGANAPIDFVRIEIARALQRKNLNIIPIVHEKTDAFNFNELLLPPDIAGIKRYEAIFFSEHPDRLFKDITHNLYPRLVSKPSITYWKFLFPIIALLILGSCAYFWFQRVKKNDLRTELEKKYASYHLYLRKDLSLLQMNTVDDILEKMAVITTDSLWMSQFEFTNGQWYGIQGKDCDPAEKDIPVTGHSLGEIYLFINELCNITNIEFDLPSAQEWEYAALSGPHHDTTLYVGSNNVDEVAWYQGNSDRKIHPSNGLQGKSPNKLDLFDMSGNVGELCNTPFVSGMDCASYIVCGGNFNSPAKEVTASSKAGINPNDKDNATGFRLIIRK